MALSRSKLRELWAAAAAAERALASLRGVWEAPPPPPAEATEAASAEV